MAGVPIHRDLALRTLREHGPMSKAELPGASQDGRQMIACQSPFVLRSTTRRIYS